MKLRREAKILKHKALSSLRRGLTAFNSYDEDGRVTTVLLHLQHACEMLLKSALIQGRIGTFDKTGRSYGFERCVNLARMHCGLTDGEAGVMRAIDSLRDAEQHWILLTEEDVLYLHARGLVTAIDELLKRLSVTIWDRTFPCGYCQFPPNRLATSISLSTASSARSLTC